MHTYVRWNFFHTMCVLALFFTWILSVPGRAESKFKDPLDFPAEMRTAITTRPLMDITYAGTALVAVGSRGMIIRSEDDGKTWRQCVVPVQIDLLAVQFPTPQNGWAVGHSGVILHSSDGGKTWTKQLDGRIAARVFEKYYKDAIARACDAAMTAAASEIDLNYKDGPTLPWLDVWFEDTQNGFVVGSFGLIAETTDGGKTWEPWLHRIDNDRWLNLNCIQGVGEEIYIAAERGMMFKLDRETRRFRGTATGYIGSFFVILGNNKGILLASGLRGVLYRSVDGGTSWEAMELPAKVTVTGGTVRSDSGGFVLVNSAGQIILGDPQGRSFSVVPPAEPMRYTGVVVADHEAASVIVSGLSGVRIVKLPGSAK